MRLSRWLIRSTYHIPGDASNDCLVACFCPCCSANQLYQTTALRGNPTPDGGAHHNLGDFRTQLGAGDARSCLYSACCMPCAVGTMMETTVRRRSSGRLDVMIGYKLSYAMLSKALFYAVFIALL
jgi:hypothetical protein